LQDAAQRHETVLCVAFGAACGGFLSEAAVRALRLAFDGLGPSWRVLWSVTEAQQQLLCNHLQEWDARRLRVEPSASLGAIFSHPAVRVFLTDGSESAVAEGLAAGMPFLCLPLLLEHYEMAEALDRHGLGLVFHKDELLDDQHWKLCSLLLRLAHEASFQKTAQRYARLVQLRGCGCRRAGDVLESIAHVGADFQELWQGVAPQS